MWMYAENVSFSAGEDGGKFVAAEVSGCIAPDTNTPPYFDLAGQAGVEPTRSADWQAHRWSVPYDRRTVAFTGGSHFRARQLGTELLVGQAALSARGKMSKSPAWTALGMPR